MEEFTNTLTKIYRGQGFMTVVKYNNSGDTIYMADKDSKKITAIETNNYSIIYTFEGHNGIIWSLDLSNDDNILISSSGDLTIYFWDTKNGYKLHQTSEKCIPKYVCTQKKLSTNLVSILCEAITKKSLTYILIYDLELIKKNCFDIYKKIEWKKSVKINCLLWLNESELLFGCDDGNIIIRNINDISGESDREYNFHSNAIKSIVWNKSMTQILTGSLDNTSKQINISNWEVKSIYTSTVPINWACFNHNDRKILVGGGIDAMNVAKTLNNDFNLKIFRSSDQKLINHIPSHFGPIRYIDKSPKNKNFLSASQDGTAKIYFIDDSDELEKIKEDINQENLGLENMSDKIFLSDEINKILNLNWKPPKVKDSKVVNWIPGMAKSNTIDLNKNNKYEINSEDNNFDEYKIKQINTTIRITNLPSNIREKDLADIFDLYGRIEERGIRIKSYDDSTMAFIKYVYVESAQKAIDNMDGYPLESLIIRVEFAKQK